MIKQFFRFVLAFAAFMVAAFTLVPGLAVAEKERPLTPTPGPKKVVQGPVLIVLGYHQFGSETGQGDRTYFLDPKELKWQFQWLKDNGWSAVTLDQVLAHWEKGKPLPTKSVLLTYDDGYRSVFTHGFKLMREFGYPGVNFVYNDFVRWETKISLHKADIDVMGRFGVTAQSHSRSHPNMGKLKDKMKPAEYQAFLDEEMGSSAEFLKERYGLEPLAIAFPYGVYTFEAVEAARKAGFRMGFTVNPGPNDAATDIMHLHRFLVVSGTTHQKFASFFEDLPLHMTRVEPSDGEVVGVVNPILSARYTDDVDPDSIKMFLGDRPLKGFKVDPLTKTVTRPLRIKLNKGGHFVSVSATDREGKTRTFSWYFRVKRNAAYRKGNTNHPPPPVKSVQAPKKAMTPTPKKKPSLTPTATPTPPGTGPTLPLVHPVVAPPQGAKP